MSQEDKEPKELILGAPAVWVPELEADDAAPVYGIASFGPRNMAEDRPVRAEEAP